MCSNGRQLISAFTGVGTKLIFDWFTIGGDLIRGVTLSLIAAIVGLFTASLLVAIGVFTGYPIATAFTVTGAVTGRPLVLTDIFEEADGFLAAFFPDIEGGTAIPDILLSSVVTPVRELMDFAQLRLSFGETGTAEFSLAPVEFTVVHPDGTHALESGEFELYAATLSQRLTVK